MPGSSMTTNAYGRKREEEAGTKIFTWDYLLRIRLDETPSSGTFGLAVTDV
jgi:hypothetical protein